MKKLGKLQREHFTKMSQEERLDVIRDAQRQMDYIAMASTKAADDKREELQARIDFCRALNRKSRA